MGQQALTAPAITINNVTAAIVPNSAVYTEGFGEQTTRTQSAGGGVVETVYSDNVETKMSKLTFSMYPTTDNIELIREWKVNRNANAASITAENFNGRTINSASVNNNYDVALGADTQIDLELMGDPAV